MKRGGGSAPHSKTLFDIDTAKQVSAAPLCTHCHAQGAPHGTTHWLLMSTGSVAAALIAAAGCHGIVGAL